MTYSYLLHVTAAALGALAVDVPPPKCSSLIGSSCLSKFSASVVNATHVGVGAKNVTGVLNDIAFCEVNALVKYGDNDTSYFDVWLPDTVYAGRFMALGNGGQAGLINYEYMMEDLNSGLGFAVAGGDGGHAFAANDVGVAGNLGAPGAYQPYLHDKDQIQAWLHDAIVLFTAAARALVEEAYGEHPAYSYYRGCSAGGAQGFAIAEFYPDLFEGLIAGGSCNFFSHQSLGFLWNQQQFQSPETALLQETLDFIQDSVLDACDTIDGVEDRLIENPKACKFKIRSLACPEDGPANDNTTCLTPAELSAVRAVYHGPVRSDTEESIYPGVALGSEAGWFLPSVSGALSNGFAIPLLQQIVFDDLSWDPDTFDWASDVDLVDEKLSPLIDDVSTDLSAFRDNGGLMIVYAGWADPNISPKWSMQHVRAITRDTVGKDRIADNDFMKLVMIPGGGHCGGSIAKYPYVPQQYGVSAAMVDWVERGKEPSDGIKSWAPPNGENRTRRLCTWPLVAKYQGGDVDDWESYACG